MMEGAQLGVLLALVLLLEGTTRT
eukprot:COSAG02_NODE_37113_length_446_cov_0.887608_1_plen_23_part_01